MTEQELLERRRKLAFYGLSLARKGRGKSGGGVSQLRQLSLSNASTPENSTNGTTVGTIIGGQSGSTFSMTDTAGSRFSLSGTTVSRGATGLNYEAATSHSVTIRETNASYSNSPRDTVIAIGVTNVFEAASLGALSLDADTAQQDIAATINITGATTGSTLSVASGALPDGLTLNSGARTISGTPTDSGTFAFTLRETLADSANSPRDNSLSIEVAAEGTFITAPDLTLTSGTDNPPVFDIDIVDDTAGEGDFVQLRIDTVDTYDSGDLLEQERILLWDGTTFVLADPDTFEPSNWTIQMTLEEGVEYFVSARIHRDLGYDDLYSLWSDDVSFTMDVPVTETLTSWASTTGANKSTYVTVGGTNNLVFTGPGGGFTGAPCSVRGTQARSTGKRYFELLIGSRGASFIHIGVDDGTDHLGDTGTTNFSRPGRNNTSGVGLKGGLGSSTCEIGFNNSAYETPTWGGTGSADGDRLGCKVDFDNDTVTFYRKLGATWSQIGNTVTGVTFAALYPNCAAEDGTTLTLCTTAASLDRALDSGFTAWDIGV